MESCKRNKRYFFWLLDPWFITWSKNICDFTKDFQCWVVGMKEEDHTLKLKIVNGISVQIVQFSSVTHHVQLFVTPWTAAHLASLSITNSWSLPKLTSIELVMPSNHLILCRPLLLPPSIFPSIRLFSFFLMSQVFTSGGQSIGVSASAWSFSFQWTPRTDLL